MKAMKGGKNGKPNGVEKKAIVKSFKETTEKIKTVASEGRYFEITIPTICQKEVSEWIEEMKDISLIKAYQNPKDAAKTILSIESVQKLDAQMMDLGSRLKDIEIRAMGLRASKEITKTEKDRTPISLTFPKSLGLNMWEEMTDKDKERVHLIGKFSAMDGETIELKFDIADCVGKDDLVRRIATIFEYADATRGKLRKKHEMDFIHSCIQKAQIFHPINQMAVKFERMTGKELIEKGYANVLNSTAKGATLFQRILNWFSAKRLYTYYYMDRVVLPEQIYVVECHKEIEPTQANHQEEIWIRYEFGEQFYRGFGITLVEHYYNDMVALHNKRQDEIEAELKANNASDNVY